MNCSTCRWFPFAHLWGRGHLSCCQTRQILHECRGRIPEAERFIYMLFGWLSQKKFKVVSYLTFQDTVHVMRTLTRISFGEILFRHQAYNFVNEIFIQNSIKDEKKLSNWPYFFTRLTTMSHCPPSPIGSFSKKLVRRPPASSLGSLKCISRVSDLNN